MPVSAKNIIWLLPLLGLSVMAGQFVILFRHYNISFDEALIDSVITIILLALFIWGMIQSINLYPTSAGALLYALLMAIIFAFATVALSNLIIKWWTNTEETTYLTFLRSSLPVRYILSWLIFGWIATYTVFNLNLSEQQRKFKKQVDTSALLKEAELFKLRQQLQPHFLYNSLNSISALTMIEPDKAQEMIGRLSDFLRNSVKREGKENVPIQEELDYLQNYLAIESIRFGDRLNVVFTDSAVESATLPPFLLQPILENAIKFGVYGNTGKITIDISITCEADMLEITITNPYDNNSSAPKGTGFGIKGIQRRLYLLYARNDLLELKKDEHTFTTTLKIPQLNA